MMNHVYNLEQMKVFVTNNPTQFDSYDDDPDNLPEINQGVAAKHPLWGRIMYFISELLESKDTKVRDGLMKQCEDSDGVVVLVDDESGELMNVLLVQTDDDFEEDDSREAVKWTSHRECMTN